MKNALRIIAVVTIAATVSAGIYVGLGIYRLLQLGYEIKDYVLEGFDDKYIHIKLFLSVQNKSDLTVNIKGYYIEIFLNDKQVGVLSSHTLKTIEPRKSSNLELPIKIDYDKAFGQVKSKEVLGYFMTKQYDKIIFSLRGKFKGQMLKIPIFTGININTSLKEIIDSM